MILKNRILTFAVALAATGAIASQVPMTGSVAFAKNKCKKGAGQEFRVVRGNNPRVALNRYNLPNNGSTTFTAFLFNSNSAPPSYQQETATFSLSGTGTGFSLSNTTGTSTTVNTTNATGSVTLTVVRNADPTQVVTVELFAPSNN